VRRQDVGEYLAPEIYHPAYDFMDWFLYQYLFAVEQCDHGVWALLDPLYEVRIDD
jgi:hypothetical protein